MIKTAFEFNHHLLLSPTENLKKTRERSGWLSIITKTLVMKLAIFLLSAALFQAHGSVVAQKVTLSGKAITLKQVFEAIEKQTDFVVFSNEDFFSKTKPISISVHQVSVTELLDLALKGQPVQYSIKYNTIFLIPKPAAVSDPVTSFLQTSQQPLIKGFLKNAEGEFLSGASVRIKQTGTGTITDGKGSFQLKTNEDAPVLQISMVGYEMVEIVLKKNNSGYEGSKFNGGSVSFDTSIPGTITVIVVMKKAVSLLEETQITAYGRTSTRLATGNIGTVKAEEIERQPVMTAIEALIGRVPGISIRQTSGNAAAPVQIVVRGINTINPNAVTDPLYVIDGIPMTTLNASSVTGGANLSMGAVQGGITHTIGENPLLSINPRDIETISILKDADATAIYGSRGANGVILITTKRAKPGPAKFSVRVSQGTKMLPRYPKMLSTQEYLSVRREAFRNDGITPDEFNAPDLKRWDTTRYTDWQRLFVGTGSVTNIDAGISGGLMQTNYAISASYATQQELMNNGGKNQRGSLRSSFNHTSNDQKFGFSLSNNIALTNVKAYLLGDLGNLAPNAPDIYNEKGEFNFAPYRGQYTPLFPFAGLKKPSDSKTFALQSNINLKYEIVRGLTISTNAGYQFSQNENANYTPEAASDPAFFAYSYAIYGNSTNKSWLVEPQLQYLTNIGKGNLSVQLITNMQSVTTRGATIMGFFFPNDALMKSYNNAQSITTTEGYREYKYVSGSAIVRYAWDNKYVINLNARRDGSSRFGPGKQFGNFGSVGLAWIASDEKWLQKILPSWFSFLKFRGSYGLTGADNIGDYEYLSRWSKSLTLDNTRNLFKYNGGDAFHVVRPLNQEFQWESTKKAELAASLGFLQNRITLELAMYRNVSSNQLTQVPTPLFTGFANAVSNWEAEIANTGIEASLQGRLIDTKDWGLNVNFNISRNRNKLLSFPNLENSPYHGMLKVGESTSAIYVLTFTGIDPMTGNATFEDRNKDGKVTGTGHNFPLSDIDDRYKSFDYMPKFTGGFGINLNYKSLSVFTQFSFVKKRRAHPYLGTIPGEQKNITLPDEVKYNHWQQPGDQAKYPRYTTNPGLMSHLTGSDAYYVNGSFLRMTNMALSYQFPAKWIMRIGMKDARFSIETQNLFAISPYRGLDPEFESALRVTPIPRTITTSISFNF